jgi:mannose-6-phosphate isomerase-like protein (cupin superfamily)
MKTVIVLILVSICFITTTVWAEDPIIYREGYRTPETDTDIDLYIHSWKDSPVHVGHGGFVEQEYLTPGDPVNPPRTGAVLKYLKAYNHGTLGPRNVTKPTTHEKEQVFFFILSGSGTVEAGGITEQISEGTGIFIPAGLTYTFKSTGEKSLQTVIIVEEITPGFEPLTEMKTGSYHDKTPGAGAHWCHVGYGIVDGTKFANPMGIGVVGIGAFDIAHPHGHVEGCEEIWNQIKGDSLLLLGKYLRPQPEGTVFLAPPDGKSAHASINQTDEPMYWLYVGNRHDLNR